MDLSVAEGHMRKGAWDEAQKEFRRLIFVTPTNPRLHAYEGVCYFRQDKFAEAIPCLKRAVDLDPKYVEAGTKLAQAYDRLHRYEEAYVVVQEMLKVKPGDTTLRGLEMFLSVRAKGNRTDGWERSIALDRKIKFSDDR